MEYGCETLSRGYVLWMALKDHLSYFLTINSSTIFQQQQEFDEVKIYRHQIPSCQRKG